MAKTKSWMVHAALAAAMVVGRRRSTGRSAERDQAPGDHRAAECVHFAHCGHQGGRQVVRAGLGALRERDAAVERSLEAEVAPVYDALQADPGRALSADKVAAALPPHSCRRS